MFHFGRLKRRRCVRPRCHGAAASFFLLSNQTKALDRKRGKRERERTTDAKEQMLVGCPGLPTRPLIYRHKQELGEWTRVECRAQRAVSVQFRFSSLSSLLAREKEREYSFLFCQRGGMVKCAAHLVVDPRSARHCIDPRLQQSLNPSFFFFYSRRDCVKIKKKLKHFGLARSLARYVFQSTTVHSAVQRRQQEKEENNPIVSYKYFHLLINFLFIWSFCVNKIGVDSMIRELISLLPWWRARCLFLLFCPVCAPPRV